MIFSHLQKETKLNWYHSEKNKKLWVEKVFENEVLNWYHSECDEKNLSCKGLWKQSIEIFTGTFRNYWIIVDQWHWLGEAEHQNFDTSFVSQIKTPLIVFINFDTGSERRQTRCRKPILSLRRKNFDFRQSDYFKRIGNFTSSKVFIASLFQHLFRFPE